MSQTTGAGVVIAKGLTRTQADACVRSQQGYGTETRILTVQGQRYHADQPGGARSCLAGVRYWGAIGLIWGGIAGFWWGFPFDPGVQTAASTGDASRLSWDMQILAGALLLGGLGAGLSALFRLGCPPASGAARERYFTRCEFRVVVQQSVPASTCADRADD